MLKKYLIGVLSLISPSSITSLHAHKNGTTSELVTLNIPSCSLNSLFAIFFLFKFSSLFRLNTLVELTVSDNSTNVNRFTLHAFVLSIEYNFRLTINSIFTLTTFLPSLSTIYFNSIWSEREVRDMFGVYFTLNSDLRRLLTDYGFDGFPLRKDFPLTGYYEVRYDDEFSSILYEPIQLTQEFRLFSVSSPWESYR